MKEEDLAQVFHYMGGITRSLSSLTYTIGGRPDHVHILTTLPVEKSLADFVRSIKAGTSKWIKGLHADYEKFSWQDGYGAFSVSESNKDAVIQYITNQKEHHRHYTAQEEFVRFLQKNGIIHSRLYTEHREHE